MSYVSECEQLELLAKIKFNLDLRPFQYQSWCNKWCIRFKHLELTMLHALERDAWTELLANNQLPTSTLRAINVIKSKKNTNFLIYT